MNLHLMKHGRHGNIDVYQSIDDGADELDFNQNDYDDMNIWIETNKIVPLPFLDSYTRKQRGKEEYATHEMEYLLTEKQSALFLLRFK